MVDLAPPAGAQTASRATTSGRRYYVLGILTVVYALNFLDRTIFNVLIEPIKKEFTLSDTTMGLLAGFGFVLFYSLLGIPIARAADRLNRRNIVAIAFAFWSAMTFLCGMAQSVASLALARIGVGIGESAGTPASAVTPTGIVSVCPSMIRVVVPRFAGSATSTGSVRTVPTPASPSIDRPFKGSPFMPQSPPRGENVLHWPDKGKPGHSVRPDVRQMCARCAPDVP